MPRSRGRLSVGFFPLTATARPVGDALRGTAELTRKLRRRPAVPNEFDGLLTKPRWIRRLPCRSRTPPSFTVRCPRKQVDSEIAERLSGISK